MWLTGLILAVCSVGWVCSSHSSQPQNQGKAMSNYTFQQMCRQTRGKSAAERRKIIKAYTRRW